MTMGEESFQPDQPGEWWGKRKGAVDLTVYDVIALAKDGALAVLDGGERRSVDEYMWVRPPERHVSLGWDLDGDVAIGPPGTVWIAGKSLMIGGRGEVVDVPLVIVETLVEIDAERRDREDIVWRRERQRSD